MGKTTRSPRKLRKKLLLERNSDDDDDFVGGGENNVVSSVMMVSYRTPKSKLKSALKTTKKKARYHQQNRYQSDHHQRRKRVKDDDEDEENRHHRILAPSSPPKNAFLNSERQTLRQVVNFDVQNERDDDEDASVGWHFDMDESSLEKKKKVYYHSLVKRPPPTPSTPFHFARDFFENGCESEVEHTTTVSSECGGFEFDLEERKEKSKCGTPGTVAYLAGQRDAYKDALLHDSLPLQKLVERQKQNVNVLTRKQEKMEDEVKEQTVLNAVLFERTNAEKVRVAKMEEIGAKLCASVEKLEREVIVLKSAEKEKQNATKLRLFMEKCVGFGAFLLGRETRSVMSESPISKKLFDTEEEFDAETPEGPSTPPKRERTSEELATSIALCVALEAIATLEASRFVPLRAPLPVRLGMYLSRVYLWSRALVVGYRDLTSATRNTVQLIVLASRLPSEYHRGREEDQKQHRIIANELAPSDASNAAALAVLEKMAWLFCR